MGGEFGKNKTITRKETKPLKGSFADDMKCKITIYSNSLLLVRKVQTIMEATDAEAPADAGTGVKSVKCSMCRKVKTSDHFINPSSDTLFHVCDNCRYLRKTKYKSRCLLGCADG